MEGSMEQLREQQMSANTGIYLLCRSATLSPVASRARAVIAAMGMFI